MSVLAPLRLDDVIVESLHVRTNPRELPNADDGEALPEPEIKVEILQAENTPRFLIPLSVRLNHRKGDLQRFGFALDLKILGFFSFDEAVEESTIGQMIHANAPAILYGVARGIAAQAFALTPVGKVVLPSVNFVEIMRRRTAGRRSRKIRRSGNEHEPPSSIDR